MTLNFFGSLEPNELDDMVLNHQSPGAHEGVLREAIGPRLPYFAITGCDVTLEQLQVFVSTH
ncbi:hypothetical protein FRC07_008256, partial [Ceratobasidium sp. 392]